MPFLPNRLPPAFLAVSLAACLFARTAGAGVVFTDKFDNDNIAATDFWAVVQPDSNLDNVASENNGRLTLFASTNAFASIGIASRKTGIFGFFSRPLTVILDGLLLKAKGIPANEARFRISLTSTAGTTPETSPSVITIRVRAGLLLLGYRAGGYKTGAPPETLAGGRVNSVAVMPLKTAPSRITLTLGPAPTDGFMRYDIVASGDGAPVEKKGAFPLTIAQWGGADEAVLLVEARRDGTASDADTGTQLSIDQITVTRPSPEDASAIPEPTDYTPSP